MGVSLVLILRKRSLLAAVLACTISPVLAQSPVSVSGTVSDQSGVPLNAVDVVVVGTNYGDASDAWGQFRIGPIPDGDYQLRASLIGYRANIKQLKIRAGVTVRLSFTMTADTLLLPEVSVSAKAPLSALSSVSPSVTVISREEIEKSGAQTVTELLAGTPGVYVKSYGSSGAQQSISIRGSEASQVLILVDGAAINGAQSGSAQINAVPIQAVERVEILRGGVSAVFGSNAMGGVINITTIRAHTDKPVDLSYHAGFGSFDTRELAFQAGQRLGRINYAVAIDWLRSDSDFGFANTSRATATRQARKNADFSSLSSFLRMAWAIDPATQLEVSGQYYDFDAGTPGEISNPTLMARSGDKRYMSRLALHRLFSDDATLSATAFYNLFENAFSDPENSFRDGQNRNISRGLQLSQKIAFSDDYNVTIGTALRNDQVTGTNIEGTPSRTNSSFFAHGHASVLGLSNSLFRRLALYPALRVDRFSGQGNYLSPKLGIVFGDLLLESLNLTASVGRSFRVPSFNSLFFISGVQVRNNPELRAEISRDADIGLTYQVGSLGRHEFSATYYRREVEGTVIWLPDFRFIWSPRNIDRVSSQGFELGYAWRSQDNQWDVRANYTFTEANFDLPGNRNPLPYRPRHLLNSEVSLHITHLVISWNQRWVSRRFTTVAGTNPIPSYRLTDVAVKSEWALGKLTLLAKVAVNNLFGNDYQVVSNFPMPGREGRVTLTVEY